MYPLNLQCGSTQAQARQKRFLRGCSVSGWFAFLLEQRSRLHPYRCYKYRLAARTHSAGNSYLSPLHPQTPGEKFN